MIRELQKSRNLFDKNATPYSTTGFISREGNLTEYANWSVSEYIKLSANTQYTVSGMNNTAIYAAVCFYTDDKTYISGIRYDRATELTFTTPANCNYALISYVTSKIDDVMLNLGSTALPYEPYGDTWNTKSYAKIVDTTQQVTSFPVVVRPMENTIPSWAIKGNMVQDGNPSPSNVIYPSECGDKTENLFDYLTMANGTMNYYLSSDGNLTSNNSWAITDYIPCNNNNFVLSKVGGNAPSICFYDENKQFISGQRYDTGSPATKSNIIATASSTAKYIRFSYITNTYTDDLSTIMLIEGSTAPPEYIPYGYKLDIKSGNTTTPVYLGEVQSTRRIKKYEFTGNETFTSVTESTIESGSYCFAMFYTNIGMEDIIDYNADMRNIDYPHYTCSHFTMKPAPSSRPNAFTDIIAGQIGANTIKEGTTYQDATYNRYLIFCMSGISTVADFKAYLAAQYAAGTPVTIWYILATETTTTLNEPIRKIDTYSDSVSGTNLSVTAQSPTTIDVDTSLKPSEMDLTYTGLKMCRRKKCASLLTDNPLNGIGTYKDTLDLATGTVTRKIKKLVLTGNEVIELQSTNTHGIANFWFYGLLAGIENDNQTVALSSHFAQTYLPIVDVVSPCFSVSTTSESLYLKVNASEISTDAEMKTFLAQQYTNGTPVTLWYIRTYATTETITVPSGLSGTEEGYLNQSSTPTPTNPIYPTANSVPYWQ